MLFNHHKIDCIHAHGLNAALIGTFLKKVFKKKLVVSIHAVYEIKPESGTARRMMAILNRADVVLSLSQASMNELLAMGIEGAKLKRFYYWIDLSRFTMSNDQKQARDLKLPSFLS